MDDETNPGLVTKPKEVSSTTSTVTTESVVTGKPLADQSHILNVSARAWLAILVTYTLCFMSAAGIEVKEPFYSVSIAIVAYFFGQATKPRTQI